MQHHRFFLRLRDVLDLSPADVERIFALGGPSGGASVDDLQQADATPAQADLALRQLLDGLIVDRRGPRPGGGAPAGGAGPELTNNGVLKKLRIALQLEDEDMQEIFDASGTPLGRYEIRALFRSPEHRNHRACSDEQLEAFLQGLERTGAGRA